MTRPPRLHDHASLRMAAWNVHKAVGSDGRRDTARVIEVVEEIAPRILVLQEVDQRLPRRPIFASDAFGALRPAVLFGRLLGWQGNVILARDAQTLRARAIHLPGGEPRGMLVVDLRLDDAGDVRVCAVHLGLLRRHRRVQIDRIVEILAALPPMPTVLAGDLNERLDGDASPLARLDALFEPAPPHGTFPAAFPFLPLDRIRGCGQVRVDRLSVHEPPLARRASDHLPLVAELRICPDSVCPRG